MNCRSLRVLFALFVLFSSAALSEETKPQTPREVRTFYIQGLECGACVYMVELALGGTKGVLAHEVVWSPDSHAVVTFDPTCLGEQEIARSVREAMPVHGTPYLPSLRLSVTDFKRSLPILEAAVGRFKKQVRLEVLDPVRGEIALHFLAVEDPATQAGSAVLSQEKWSTGALRKALDQVGPEGRAVRYRILAAPSPQ